MYDVVIIGGGAAGLTAAIYACRKALKTLVISPEYGGQTNLTSHIENYPGFIVSTGWDLMAKFKEHAEHFGAETRTGKVITVEKKGEKQFHIHFDDGSKEDCKAVILCHGKLPRPLNIPGEKEFLGRGLSTCATCDAPLYKNKAVAVIGGGNAALEAVEELQHVGAKVTLVHRRDQFRADEITVKKVKALEGVTFILNHAPVAIKGDKYVTCFEIEDVNTKQKQELKLDGVFSEIGHVADSTMVKDLCKLNPAGEVIVDDAGNTSCPGIFAAGDITPVKYKQTVIAAGEGAKAALECHRWLTGGKATGEYSK
ncbi:FAD-dependent oxidoreductase [Candidatus Woesearchaeota archaeon]|nr:FAD-dependent oxidoreductase [Candidatus Woesearchaeota archaeon]